MIEANAVALNFPAGAEIAEGSTRETVLLPRSEKRILNDWTTSVFSFRSFSKRQELSQICTRFLPFGVRSQGGSSQLMDKGTSVLIFRIAKAYRWN